MVTGLLEQVSTKPIGQASGVALTSHCANSVGQPEVGQIIYLEAQKDTETFGLHTIESAKDLLEPKRLYPRKLVAQVADIYGWQRFPILWPTPS